MVREEPLDSPGIVVPPPAIYAAGLLAGWAVHHFHPIHVVQPLIGWILIALSLLLQFAAFREFKRHRTSFRPDQPATHLITGGPFRRCRNPLYTSLSLIALGIGLLMTSLWMMLGVVAAHVAIRVCVVPREERYLESRFGDAYRAYRDSVPRWF